VTDAEIIKALRECTNNGYNSEDGTCRRCPLQDFSPAPEECMTELLRNALALINRQKAEIERLESEIDKQYEVAEANVRAEIADGGTSCHWCGDKVRAEAIKEFLERLKAKFDRYAVDYTAYAIVDDVAKEMGVGDNA
jgi:hypothetical protein